MTAESGPSQEIPSMPRDALGLGLRLPHYVAILEPSLPVDYLEIISENFMGMSGPPQQHLERVLRRYPLVMHGVGLNILGHEPLVEDYLNRLCRLADKVNPAFVSDHLCWVGAHGYRHHDLLPTPFTRDLIGYAAERVALVQKRLGRPLALENLSSYVSFPSSEMEEWEFYTAVVEEADAYYMLDINNIYVSSQNLGFDPEEYLRHIPFDRVLQVHLAGHERNASGTIIDTHSRPVAAAVWDLYQKAWHWGGPFPTLLEWDEAIPPLPELLDELDRARRVRTCKLPG